MNIEEKMFSEFGKNSVISWIYAETSNCPFSVIVWSSDCPTEICLPQFLDQYPLLHLHSHLGQPKPFNEHIAFLVKSRLQVIVWHLSCWSPLQWFSRFSIRFLLERAEGLADIFRTLFSVNSTIIINFKNFTKFILLRWFASAQL